MIPDTAGLGAQVPRARPFAGSRLDGGPALDAEPEGASATVAGLAEDFTGKGPDPEVCGPVCSTALIPLRDFGRDGDVRR